MINNNLQSERISKMELGLSANQSRRDGHSKGLADKVHTLNGTKPAAPAVDEALTERVRVLEKLLADATANTEATEPAE